MRTFYPLKRNKEILSPRRKERRVRLIDGCRMTIEQQSNIAREVGNMACGGKSHGNCRQSK